MTGGGGDNTNTDYCAAAPILVNKGGSGCTASNKCGECEGDCDSDSDCHGSLKCFQRNNKTPVYGCMTGGGGDNKDTDYCAVAAP